MCIAYARYTYVGPGGLNIKFNIGLCLLHVDYVVICLCVSGLCESNCFAACSANYRTQYSYQIERRDACVFMLNSYLMRFCDRLVS